LRTRARIRALYVHALHVPWVLIVLLFTHTCVRISDKPTNPKCRRCLKAPLTENHRLACPHDSLMTRLPSYYAIRKIRHELLLVPQLLNQSGHHIGLLVHDFDPDRPHYLARRCFPRRLWHFALRHHFVDELLAAGPSRPPASTTNPCTAPLYVLEYPSPRVRSG
jgi:hypothetical protein